MQEFMVEPLHIGSHVLVQGLVSKAHLNGKHGFVYGQRGDDRWLVALCEMDCDPSNNTVGVVSSANLQPLAWFEGLKVIPVGDSSAALTLLDIEDSTFRASLPISGCLISHWKRIKYVLLSLIY